MFVSYKKRDHTANHKLSFEIAYRELLTRNQRYCIAYLDNKTI